MNFRQLILSVSIIALPALGLYLSISPERQSPPVDEARLSPPPQAAPAPRETASPLSATPQALTEPDPAPGEAGRKVVEIFGRVADSDGRPIENAVIAEERYYQKARSDRDGNYVIRLEMPRHRYPTLHFLRNGYAAKRVKVGKKQLDSRAAYRLDVALEDSLGSVGLRGWVGDEFGAGLEAARVELAASYPRNDESYYLTEFTDADGNFEFEGVHAEQNYRFTVDLSPDYPVHLDEDLRIAHDNAPINLRLEKLRLVDIDGLIVNRDSMPVPGYEIYLSNLVDEARIRKIVSDSSGYFRLDGVPLGEIRLSTRGAEFYRISGMRLTELEYQNLRLVVDRGDNYLSGWVSDVNGVAVGNAMVTLDREFRHDEVLHNSYHSRRTDPNGAFAFAQLGDGEYHLTIYAQGYAKREFTYRFENGSEELFLTLERD